MDVTGKNPNLITSYSYNFIESVFTNITSESLIKLLLVDKTPPSVTFESTANKDASLERPQNSIYQQVDIC